MSKTIGIRLDIETRSREEIKYGSYVYAGCPDFRVLVVAYSPIRLNEGDRISLGAPKILDLTKPNVAFRKALANPGFQKHAFNANFERVALSRWLGMETGDYLDPEGWFCSAVNANVHGVSGSLDEVARAVRSPVKKDPEGRRLINLFSKPDKKTGVFHVAEYRVRCWCGEDHSRDLIKFEDYCKNDVVTEAMVSAGFPSIPGSLQAEYEADQRINDRGIRHQRKLSERAVAAVEVEKNRLMAELSNLTGVDNPNSVQQMRVWLEDQGYPMPSLAKAARERALDDPECPKRVKKALILKGAASLSSVAKHQAALNTRCDDGRIRGTLQFYGAHTGREAGRGLQPQNLPRYEAPEADRRRLIKGKAGADAPTIAKGTVRASLIPAKKHVFVVVDENAIEARCLGNLAGEKWVEDEFKTGDGAIYEATAATMFGVNKKALVKALASCGKCGACPNCDTRSKGKVSNLALGYAGGAGALVTMGAEDAGIDCGNYPELHREWEELGKPGKFHEWNTEAHEYPELLRLRDLYREASPMTVRFWKLCAKAWDIAATSGNGVKFGQDDMVTMIRDGRHNRLILPSGRSIWYRYARVHADPDRPDRIDRRTFIGKANGRANVRVDTHGGKLTENITQAYARDVLFDVIMKIEALTAQGWPGQLVLHVHDEVVVEAPEKHAEQVLADVKGLMSVPPSWAPSLAVRGAGGIMERYGK